MQGDFSREFLLTPDYCGAQGQLSPLAVFTIFQAIASEHAERIGVGGAAMAKRGAFWLTVHNRIDFFAPASLMQCVTARTWPEACAERAVRSFRSYTLHEGSRLLARGRTQWAVLGSEGRVVPFGASGFPADFPFLPESALDAAPTRFRDTFAPGDFVREYTVRATDIDLGHHMNNISYIRVLLDCFSAAQLASGAISSIEAHYSAPCLEGETLSVFRHQAEDTVLFAIRKADGKAAFLGAVRLSRALCS